MKAGHLNDAHGLAVQSFAVAAFSQEKLVIQRVINSTHHHAAVLEIAPRNAAMRNLTRKIRNAVDGIHKRGASVTPPVSSPISAFSPRHR